MGENLIIERGVNGIDFPRSEGGFQVILADPPWRFKTFSAIGRGRCPDGLLSEKKIRNLSRQDRPERHYPTMTMEDLISLPVLDIASRNCVLFMWAVDPMLPQALELGKSWGFKYKTVAFYWAKTRRESSSRGDKYDFPMGTGYWTRANPESCLLFTRGSPKRVATDVRKLIVAPRREHSRKPDEQYVRIERLCGDSRRVELFSRTSRPGWAAWGNDVDTFNLLS